MLWLMLQPNKPEDFVIATGVQSSATSDQCVRDAGYAPHACHA